jgi:large subunit ribosomal protein L11
MPPKKEVMAKIKLQCPAGGDARAPVAGARPARREHRRVREALQRRHEEGRRAGDPCIVTVYKDRTFDMVYRTPPASVLLKKFANVGRAAARRTRRRWGP